MTDARPLEGIHVVNLGINLPGPAAAGRLVELGAAGTKVEPAGGDPLAVQAPSWYEVLTAGQRVVRLNLKDEGDRAALDDILAGADVFITSSRPAALARLGLAQEELDARFPRLVQVAIVGHPAPRQHVAGHDLTYQAALGLVTPPALPRTLIADLGGAERTVSTALALLVARDRPGAIRRAEVALEEAAAYFAGPLRHGVTVDGGLLGGRNEFYGIYEAADGFVALAALEPHFAARLCEELGLAPEPGAAGLADRFRSRGAAEWEAWAEGLDLPIVAVKQPIV